MRLQDFGAPEVDSLISTGLEPSDDPKADLIRYLETLVRVLRERSRGAYRAALSLLRAHVAPSEGDIIRDIYVSLTEAEQEAYALRAIALRDLPDYGSLIAELESLLRDFYEEPVEEGTNE